MTSSGKLRNYLSHGNVTIILNDRGCALVSYKVGPHHLNLVLIVVVGLVNLVLVRVTDHFTKWVNTIFYMKRYSFVY